MITTRKGYRKNKMAKQYIQEVLATEKRKVNLRVARQAIEVRQECIKKLMPLTQKQRIKVIRAVAILLDIEGDFK